MAKIYVRKIRAEEISIESVPERWRKQVEELLAERTDNDDTVAG